MMKALFMISVCLVCSLSHKGIYAQKTVEHYAPKKNDSIRIGKGAKDFFPFIQNGYTLQLPKATPIKGVLIFLEDSGYDNKNKSAKQIYKEAASYNFAVLSVSTEIPFDFFFNKASLQAAHNSIQQAFETYQLPNQNVFFLGGSLTGHRAMRYLHYANTLQEGFKLQTHGLVICNFTLDWTRKWHQHQREFRINRNNLWEARFMNYMLETHLKGTPETAPENYHRFSAYSYFDKENRNIAIYKNLAIRAYAEPAIEYRFKKYLHTMYESNTTDILGFLAALQLAGNQNTSLVVLQPQDNPTTKKNAAATWMAVNKKELMHWISQQTK
ncbi:MAG: hypothetical protein OIF50_12180 [Flavobacteriaceae bacterium]|nr:hypothetical protein [Flavobacteriaceae bacterium]